VANIGSIGWPTWLDEDAADKYGYINPTIQNALDHAYETIILILNEVLDHPLMSLWSKMISKHKTWPPENLSVLHHTLDQFKTRFQLNVLPADFSLTQRYLPHLRHDLGQIGFSYLHELAIILFKVVIMRVYLGRQPCDDGQIFFLAYQAPENSSRISPDDPLFEAKLGSLCRHKTLPECVLDSTARLSHKLRCEIKRIEFPPNFLLASALGDKGQPYQFFHSTATGLYNIKPFVPRFHDPRFLTKALKYTPSPEQAPKPRPRPKPKPTALSKKQSLIPSQPWLIMHDYNPSYATDSQNQPLALASSKPTKRQRNDSDDNGLFVPVASESTSDSRKVKHQRSQEGDGPEPQVLPGPRRSGRLKK
jgi:hypothetical protein